MIYRSTDIPCFIYAPLITVQKAMDATDQQNLKVLNECI